MSGEQAERTGGGTESDDERASRREELHARVREANRQSRTGPDSPSLGQTR